MSVVSLDLAPAHGGEQVDDTLVADGAEHPRRWLRLNGYTRLGFSHVSDDLRRARQTGGQQLNGDAALLGNLLEFLHLIRRLLDERFVSISQLSPVRLAPKFHCTLFHTPTAQMSLLAMPSKSTLRFIRSRNVLKNSSKCGGKSGIMTAIAAWHLR
jgi:hypothetical protein